MRLVLTSAKGSPGVTTASIALAAAADALLIELDPSGGSIECWTGVTGEPGLVVMAGGLRRSPTLDPEAVNAAINAGIPTIDAILAPTSGSYAESTIASLAGGWATGVGTHRDVFADCGRWSPSQRSAGRILGADAVLLVCQPDLNGVESARHLVDALRSAGSETIGTLVVGDRPYQPEEVATALGVPLMGALPWDPRSRQLLLRSGHRGPYRRSRLARAAEAAVGRLRETVIDHKVERTDA
jgi:Mrp family chromosome partitioning ATPase